MHPFHVLALSGGGYRGLYTATILAELEAKLGGPLARRFDLICGTSVGGILAMGLALEIPARKLQELFLVNGGRIFRRRWLGGGLFLLARHPNAGLKAVIGDIFDEATLGQLQHRVLIPTVNYSTGLAQMFKTSHHPTFETDHEMRLVDVAMATSAAPTYLPIYGLPQGKFVDGGLIANSPGLLGLHEAVHFIGADPEQIRLTRIGTMSQGRTIRGDSWLDRGFLMWRSKLFDLTISAQESVADAMLRHSLGDRYFVIDDNIDPDQAKDVAKLDKVSRRATDTLVTRGLQRAKCALGDTKFTPFREHMAEPAIFHHGPRKAAA
jgi:hypothetical protein